MPLKIVRNDITKMQTEAIVNTANHRPTVGTGCDYAIYQAAGMEEMLAYRKEHIGHVPEGEAFITPGFHLSCKYIIHAVSPLFIDGNHEEEKKLRSCYQKALALAKANKVKSISFPLISTGGFGYPKEEGMRIAVDEINAFLMRNDMLIYLVVFDEKATSMGTNLYPGLESYIDRHYVAMKQEEEYIFWRESRSDSRRESRKPLASRRENELFDESRREESRRRKDDRTSGITLGSLLGKNRNKKPSTDHTLSNVPCDEEDYKEEAIYYASSIDELCPPSAAKADEFSIWKDDKEEATIEAYEDSYGELCDDISSSLEERMSHISDTFSEYLMYLIDSRGMTYPEVYKRAIVDKKAFSKIKNNRDAHPKKITAMCLCVGAKLNMDQTRDLLARAGYALSPCDKTDIIFSYFIENEIYDMIELDIQLEAHGCQCLIA